VAVGSRTLLFTVHVEIAAVPGTATATTLGVLVTGREPENDFQQTFKV